MLNLTSDNIFIMGDIHGEWSQANARINKLPKNSIIIQLGDFGFDPKNNFECVEWPPKLKLNDRKLLFIAGNHESHPDLPDSVCEIYENITYLPKGELFKINDFNFLALGGADTVSWDRFDRTWGKTIFKDEGLPIELVDSIIEKSPKIDVVVSHSAPLKFNIPVKLDIYEDTRINLNKILELHPSHWFFAHFHISVNNRHQIDDNYVCNWRCLNIFETRRSKIC